MILQPSQIIPLIEKTLRFTSRKGVIELEGEGWKATVTLSPPVEEWVLVEPMEIVEP